VRGRTITTLKKRDQGPVGKIGKRRWGDEKRHRIYGTPGEGRTKRFPDGTGRDGGRFVNEGTHDPTNKKGTIGLNDKC